MSESRSVVSDSVTHGLYSPWNSPGRNTGVGSCFLLQGIFPTQGSNLGLSHCRRILYQLSHQGSPWHVVNTNFAFWNYLEFSPPEFFLICDWLNPQMQNSQIQRADSTAKSYWGTPKASIYIGIMVGTKIEKFRNINVWKDVCQIAKSD